MGLKNQGKTSCNQFTCQKFNIDEKEFATSDIYNTMTYGTINLATVKGGPLEISNPYFINGLFLYKNNIKIKFI